MDVLIDIITKYLPIAISVLALFFTLLNNRRSGKRSVYFEIDKQYGDLLKIALNNPELRDFSKTSEYMKEEKNSTFYIRYNLYAYMVWNTLETIFDQHSKKNATEKTKLNTWLPVIKEENKIHYCWFKHNIHLFKPDFSNFVIKELNDLQIKRAAASDLKSIYDFYVQQFPAEERKPLNHLKHLLQSGNYYFYIAYHNYLPQNENIIGYAFLFTDEQNKGLWIDYLAVIPGFQSSGYGTAMLNKIIDDMGGGNYNTFLEVEIPESDDPKDPMNKRMKFYQKLDCQRMPYEYYLPTYDGKDKLYLYCRPKDKAGTLYKGNIQAVITNALSFIHSDITHVKDIINENVENITEDFHYNIESHSVI